MKALVASSKLAPPQRPIGGGSHESGGAPSAPAPLNTGPANDVSGGIPDHRLRLQRNADGYDVRHTKHLAGGFRPPGDVLRLRVPDPPASRTGIGLLWGAGRVRAR